MAVFMVRIPESGEGFPCSPGRSVLESMALMGHRGIPLGCRGGGCGVCKVEVVSGSFSSKAMSRCHISEDDQRAGRVLACRIFPESDLELRVAGAMERLVTKCCVSR